MPIEFAAISERGRGYEHNLESADVFPDYGVMLVSDACMGFELGRPLGSHVAREASSSLLAGSLPSDVHDRQLMRELFAEVAQAIETRCAESPITAVCAVLTDNRACVGWLGDCRAYKFRESKLMARTTDHTLREEYRRTGRIKEFPESHRRVITRSVAPGYTKDLEPDVTEWLMSPGDVILLCSKGVCRGCGDGLSDDRIAAILAQELDMNDAARRFIREAKAVQGDNVSVALARYSP